jgi:hypothetical protein
MPWLSTGVDRLSHRPQQPNSSSLNPTFFIRVIGMALSDLPQSFTRRQAGLAGVSDADLAQLVQSGCLVRVRRGVFARPDDVAPEERASRHVDLVRAALDGRRAVYMASHLSAVAVYGLPLPLAPVDTVHLTGLSPQARSKRRPGLWLHHADSYVSDARVQDGLLVSSPARTVADCLRVFSPRVSVPVADAALHREMVTRDELLLEMAMQCHWTGRLRADSAVPLVDGRRETWLESYAFVRLAEWDVPLPQPQVEVFDETGRFVARTDGAWVEDATVLELDGMVKYRLAKAGLVDPDAVFAAEKARYDRIGNLGAERVRFGLDDLLHHEVRVKTAIRSRRQCGSMARFSGSFRVPTASGLLLL